ncbi:cellulose synthase operon protein YhjQ/BcsQ [Sphingomonas sp. NFR15]|uniref:cellulose synthase operon protein YhjQ/BcsQ n=1 Tax=Sphingomonas sp. NFR15 TaxID=1566282 RepID=UPI00088E0C16|nr:cellulose synthase operon protein YhjQ/BcsQ [Sphingomonas sp. NFR15]SDA28309.1 Cellulose biosynthesis protein BcsQ [Sphingomonas sp. NFR15]
MIVLFHSPKGGVGTSAVAANLALVLAERGVFVTAVDLTGQGALALCLGDSSGVIDRSRQAEGDAAMIVAGVRVMAPGADRTAAEIVAAIQSHEDEDGDGVVIVDIGSGDRHALDLLLPLAALRLCVLTPDPAALAALPLVYRDVQATRDDRTFFLLNRVDDRLRLGRDIATMLRGLLGDRLLGTIRRDEAVGEALAMLETLASFAPASAALADFRAIAGRLVPERADAAQPERGIA